MALKVIGAGFGRTGTMSLKRALEMLGFAPCYHMIEVFDNPEHVYHWHDFVFGKSNNWEDVFANYQAAVDWPACHFWQELAAAYAEAKVILTVRSPESWYRSASNTILQGGEPPSDEEISEKDKVFHEMVQKMIREDTFDNRFEDEAYAIQVFKDHIERVRQTIAPERLLVFQARDGWEPLCHFLDVPIPEESYPHANSTEEFLAKQEENRAHKANAEEQVILSLLGRPLTPPPGSDLARQQAERNLAEAQANFAADPNLENTIWVGRRLAYLFRYAEAIAAFTAGIERWPQAHELYRHRGHRYISTRQFEKAVIDLERAAALAANQPVTVEPDGIPNKLNQPTSNSHFNIWYHLGLAYYLLGQWQTAVSAYQTCLAYCDNADSLTATVDWLYMTYCRLGNVVEAQKLLECISEDMELIESQVYHNRLLMYKGLRTPDSLLNPQAETAESTDLAFATQGYGVGNWYLYNGDQQAAKTIFERVLQSQNWSAFGYIAAEVEILRLL